MTTIDWIIVLALNGPVILYALLKSGCTRDSKDWFLAGPGQKPILAVPRAAALKQGIQDHRPVEGQHDDPVDGGHDSRERLARVSR